MKNVVGHERCTHSSQQGFTELVLQDLRNLTEHFLRSRAQEKKSQHILEGKEKDI